MPIRNRLAEMHEEITGWRRHIHANPELQFDVHETAAFVTDKLRSFGVDEVTEGIGRTGVVAVIKGREPGSRTIGLRADMDALPITEATGLDYASQNPGKMHACGHDGHTAMLLGAAQYLAETRNFAGTAVLIFQPAEEGGGGGREMVEDGLMDRWKIDEVYGMHNMPGLPTGQFAIRPGPLLAAADMFTIRVVGKGGHAAAPHQAVDPNVAAAHVIVALQSIASRVTDPLASVVVTIGALHSDSVVGNVIPHVVTMEGTVRALDESVRAEAQARVIAIAEATAQAHGCTAEIDYVVGYPVTVNADENTAHAAEAARAVAGDVDANCAPIMAAEDFAYMLNARPGAYIMIGNGDTAMVHHPAYNFDDDAIPAGCSWFAEVIEQRLPLGK
ncbi:MAG: M20 aminoacylase family protein [Pseudomonadota bacterium]